VVGEKHHVGNYAIPNVLMGIKFPMWSAGTPTSERAHVKNTNHTQMLLERIPTTANGEVPTTF
jgi:hypothetical protein